MSRPAATQASKLFDKKFWIKGPEYRFVLNLPVCLLILHESKTCMWSQVISTWLMPHFRSCNIFYQGNSFFRLPFFLMLIGSNAPEAHQMEPSSPIQALRVNPFPSRFIIRTVPRGDVARRQWKEPITTTKWQCYCTSSNSRKFGVDRPNTIISQWNVTLAFSSLRDFLSFLSSG